MVVYPASPKTIRKGALPRIIHQFSVDTDLLWRHRWYRLFFSRTALSGMTYIFMVLLCFALWTWPVVFIVINTRFCFIINCDYFCPEGFSFSKTWDPSHPAVIWFKVVCFHIPPLTSTVLYVVRYLLLRSKFRFSHYQNSFFLRPYQAVCETILGKAGKHHLRVRKGLAFLSIDFRRSSLVRRFSSQIQFCAKASSHYSFLYI